MKISKRDPASNTPAEPAAATAEKKADPSSASQTAAVSKATGDSQILREFLHETEWTVDWISRRWIDRTQLVKRGNRPRTNTCQTRSDTQTSEPGLRWVRVRLHPKGATLLRPMLGSRLSFAHYCALVHPAVRVDWVALVAVDSIVRASSVSLNQILDQVPTPSEVDEAKEWATQFTRS